MAGVSVDSGGGGGRKSVDSNVNMVPMIDLLISVIAFLLMTAVWVQTGTVQARQPESSTAPVTAPDIEHLTIALRRDGVSVGLSAADRVAIPADARRLDALREALARHRAADRTRREVWIQPDSDVAYDDIIRVMDVVYEVWGRGGGGASARRAEELVTVRLM